MLNSIKALEKERDTAKKLLHESHLEYMSKIYILEEEAAEAKKEKALHLEQIVHLKSVIAASEKEIKRLLSVMSAYKDRR